MRKCLVAILWPAIFCSLVSAGELDKWSFHGSADEVFRTAARVVQHNWTVKAADRKLQSIRFETRANRDTLAAVNRKFVCNSRTEYLATLREIRPGLTEISLTNTKAFGFSAKVEECVTERIFLGVQTELNPETSPPPKLSRDGLAAFNRYLAADDDKAFVADRDGVYGYSINQRFRSEAVRKALEACARHSLSGCKVVMLNGLKAAE